jgi:hypothetical protein
MPDLDNFELQRTAASPPEEPPRIPSPSPGAPGRWILGAIVLLATAAAIYVNVARRPSPSSAPAPASTSALAKEPARPLGGEAEPVTIPPLADSDPVVRTLVRALSNHELVAAWLATDGLIRNFTVAVANIADGASPAKQMTALRPATRFRVVESSGRTYVDPGSYDRYAKLADAVLSIEPAGAARVYGTLKPRIEEAYGELGAPGREFDQVLEKAIVTLLRTPTPDGRLQVQQNEQGIGYGFVDSRFEGLSDGQKALLRMGPHNARIIKARLRDIALALGIPASTLPQ